VRFPRSLRRSPPSPSASHVDRFKARARHSLRRKARFSAMPETAFVGRHPKSIVVKRAYARRHENLKPTKPPSLEGTEVLNP
jgi:hypothetical protein